MESRHAIHTFIKLLCPPFTAGPHRSSRTNGFVGGNWNNSGLGESNVTREISSNIGGIKQNEITIFVVVSELLLRTRLWRINRLLPHVVSYFRRSFMFGGCFGLQVDVGRFVGLLGRNRGCRDHIRRRCRWCCGRWRWGNVMDDILFKLCRFDGIVCFRLDWKNWKTNLR